MKIHANQVFTPSSLAEASFVERSLKITSQIVDSLNTPGKQIVIYGYSGCGKSTLIINKLSQVYENQITTRCMHGMTLENLLADGFDQIGQFINDKQKQRSFSINPKISLEYADIKGSFSFMDFSTQTAINQKQLLPPQLTAQRLAKFFGEAKCCWILEDFHKIVGVEKSRVSQIMKVFMDMSRQYPALKIIAIGAVGTAREVIQFDHEMNNRVSEVLIPPMDSTEIIDIISKGEKLLNTRFTQSQKKHIAEYSCGIPAICHQLCLNMCFINGIYETQSRLKIFNDEDLEDAIEKLIAERSDSLKEDFELATRSLGLVSGVSVVSVLKAALKTSKNEFTLSEIKQNIDIELGDLEVILMQLSSTDRGEVFIYNEPSDLYRFNNLFIKNYILMNLSQYEEVPELILLKEKTSIDKLLEIIHKDLSDDFVSVIIE